MKKIFNVILFIIPFCYCNAQSLKEKLLSLEEYIQTVKNYHPMVKQANLQTDKADANLMAARGNFDPVLEYNISNKSFSNKDYYSYQNAGINIPLPVGSINAGIENNSGLYLSPEVTAGKSSYVGLEVPLAKGLFLDTRRAALQQAKIYLYQSEAERAVMLNELLYQSYVAYWQWAGAYRQYKTFSKFIELAEKRMRLVRISYTQGERSQMDTTEAWSQFQNYRLMQTDALMQLQNTTLYLNSFLWQNNNLPAKFAENFIPQNLDISGDGLLEEITGDATITTPQNPELEISNFKIKHLLIDQKLQKQNRLPYVTLKTYILNKNYYFLKNVNPAFIENNNKWGIAVKMPLLLRTERAKYKLATLKVQEAFLNQKIKQNETEIKIRSSLFVYNTLKLQITANANVVETYEKLLKNEELKFTQGESSLFLINSREIKLLETLQKQTDLSVKYYKAKYSLQLAEGNLWQKVF